MNDLKKIEKKVKYLLEINEQRGIYTDQKGVIHNLTLANIYAEIENLRESKANKYLIEGFEKKLKSLESQSELNFRKIQYLERQQQYHKPTSVNNYIILFIIFVALAILILWLR